MKHTQGKWEWYRSAEDKYQSELIVYDEKENVIVATRKNYTISDEELANIQLIASAPELLEACKVALNSLRSSGWNDGSIECLEKAIAKAEGKI